MTIKIADLMATQVVSATPHQSVGYVRELVEKNKIHAVPIIGPDNEPLGIVTTADLARRVKDESPISRIMSRNVTVVPAYNDVNAAARIMRKNHIHHVVVTHEKAVIGLISSFDLLKLVEGHRFVDKNAQKSDKKKPKKSRKKKGNK